MKWTKGQSGNPAGKPVGAGEIGKLRAQLGTAVPAILTKMAQLAIDGDVQAAKVILERVVPSVKNTELPITIDLPEGALTDKASAIMQAVANGQIAPGVGSQLIAALGQVARVAEIDELDRRMAAIEARNNGNP